MKTKISILLTLCVVVIVLFACVKAIDNPTQPEKVLDDVTEQSLSLFIQNHYDKKYKLLVEKIETKSEDVTRDIYSDYLIKNEANKLITDVNDEKLIRSRTDLQYVDYLVKSRIKSGTLKKDGDNISFLVYVYHVLYENEINPETGKRYKSSGIDLYEMVVKERGNSYVIIKESEHEFIGGPESEQFHDSSADNDEILLKSGNSYSYSAKKAVKFANKYWDNVTKLKDYFDYSNQKGDCTNFLSHCLKEGNWTQNSSWFFISDGASGNDMKKYKRSPSWTKANDFYGYITATGSMYRNSNGNKRVVAIFSNLLVPQASDKTSKWSVFYNKIKQLELGDIVQLGDGEKTATIFHSMIVTTVISKAPYVKVTYRNATGHSSQNDLPIDKLSGKRLYGFNVI